MRTRLVVPVALALAAATAAVPIALTATGGAAARKPKFAQLTGAAERPGPGDANGRGSATILIPSPGKVCFALLDTGLDTPNAAHIHRGGPGVAGPVVVGLAPPATGTAGAIAACVGAPTSLTSEIAAHPGRFYVNIHTGKFPGGAIRGQLKVLR